ncbi:hypothetical protein LOAG_00902 [Loa loa]|uniref:Uncharacterized protein n=1 Tax=Loa loa TaxID=7209 RepID=A0A1S0UAC8_LOALO|nr:hypothetical protein LOAG_00902 [Loa loa]EFO27583.1 hypothetical protein LOAG_00902 [Loa loa]
MDEAPVMEHLSYGKVLDELQTADDVIQEDNLETISNVTVAAADPFNQHDYSVDFQMESMTLNADYPMKPERRASLDGYNENTTEVLTENTMPGPENWEQKDYDQNVFSMEERLWKKYSPAQEPLVSDDRAKEMHSVREELKDDIAPRIHKSPLQDDKQSRRDFMSYDYDKFNSNFANNSFVSSDNASEFNLNYADNNNDNTANNILTKPRNDDLPTTLSQGNKMSNDVQFSSLAKQANGFELISHNDSITTETNDCRNDSGNNLKNAPTKEQSSEDSLRKLDDVRKISDRLEAFSFEYPPGKFAAKN